MDFLRQLLGGIGGAAHDTTDAVANTVEKPIMRLMGKHIDGTAIVQGHPAVSNLPTPGMPQEHKALPWGQTSSPYNQSVDHYNALQQILQNRQDGNIATTDRPYINLQGTQSPVDFQGASSDGLQGSFQPIQQARVQPVQGAWSTALNRNFSGPSIGDY